MTQEIESVSYARAREMVLAAHAAGLPVCLLGQPGVGKSALAWDVSHQIYGEDVEPADIRTTLIDPVDLRGIPSLITTPNGDGRDHLVTTWAEPDFLPRDARLIILEEIAAAPQSVQTSCFQLVLDRRLGSYRMHKDAYLMMMGNRVQDRAGSGILVSALRDRALIIQVEPDADSWLEWAFREGVATEVCTYIRWKGTPSLAAFDPAAMVSPTPRSWAMAGRLLPHLPAGVEFQALSGLIGPGEAATFTAFLRVYRDLPDPDAILMAPDKADIPDVGRPDICYALVGALAERISEANGERMMRYANRLSDASLAEYSVLLVTLSIMKDKAATLSNREAQKWLKANADFVH